MTEQERKRLKRLEIIAKIFSAELDRVKILEEALEEIEAGKGEPLNGSDRADSYAALMRRAETALIKYRESE